ncbi:serine hydrolase [Streptomyces apocyni]|uniref:hypothetical protein n=1 Tax=Streptomyces apocyni TaxID=2654677 RepID=UPI0012EAA2A9|nr:hypothetical protein [Streptomyces apocyni]
MRRLRYAPVATAVLLGWGLVGCAQNQANVVHDAAPPRHIPTVAPSALSTPREAVTAEQEAATGAREAAQEAVTEVAVGADPEANKRLAEALASVLPDDGPTRLSVAVLDLGDGALAVHGGEETYDTASIVKVDILATLLLQAQDEGRELTERERAAATDMIVNSGNDSATELWEAIGGAAGLDAANQRLGLTGTTAGENGEWGLTQTTAADQVALLRAVFGGPESELVEASRAYVQELMGGISDGQGWGVSAAGSNGALKNGWLPRSASGLWDVNSIGRVTTDDGDRLVAVISDGHATMEDGVALVEASARAGVASLTS